MTTQAKVSHKWEFSHDMIGYNYRMPNINAALGCAQLEQLPDFVEKKRKLAKKYAVLLKGIEGVEFFQEPDFGKSNYWLNAIIIDETYIEKRNEFLSAFNDNGVMARPIWNLMYTMPMFAQCPRMDCLVAENIGKRLINIPSSVVLGNVE